MVAAERRDLIKGNPRRGTSNSRDQRMDLIALWFSLPKFRNITGYGLIASS